MTLPAPRHVVEKPGEVQGNEPDARESHTATERLLAEILADVARVEHAPTECNFFDDFGADSLTMAHFRASVREHPDLPSVSIRGVYGHPTIRFAGYFLLATSRYALGYEWVAAASGLVEICLRAPAHQPDDPVRRKSRYGAGHLPAGHRWSSP